MAKQEYPKTVYGPGDETAIINEAAEMPEGFMTFREKFYGQSPEDKAKAPKDTGAATKAYRAKLMSYLDEHQVAYAKNLATDKLQELADKLTAHLAAQTEQADGDGQ